MDALRGPRQRRSSSLVLGNQPADRSVRRGNTFSGNAEGRFVHNFGVAATHSGSPRDINSCVFQKDRTHWKGRLVKIEQ